MKTAVLFFIILLRLLIDGFALADSKTANSVHVRMRVMRPVSIEALTHDPLQEVKILSETDQLGRANANGLVRRAQGRGNSPGNSG